MANGRSYTIGRARRRDLAFIQPIELAAARLLEGYAPESVLAAATSEQHIARAYSDRLLWVARRDGCPVGFAHVVVHGNRAHLAELDVLPAHGRRGVGGRLVLTVCRWARSNRLKAVTLTTFRDVPWNMPFYAKLGFEEIPKAKLKDSLRRILRAETRSGLDPARRVAMQLVIHASTRAASAARYSRLVS